jgi:hypothetical protein
LCGSKKGGLEGFGAPVAELELFVGGGKNVVHSLPPTPLEYVEVVFLPPNTTPYIQPMDQGIIAAVKSRFKKRQLQAAVDRMTSGNSEAKDIYNIDQFSAMSGFKKIGMTFLQQTCKIVGNTRSYLTVLRPKDLCLLQPTTKNPFFLLKNL